METVYPLRETEYSHKASEECLSIIKYLIQHPPSSSTDEDREVYTL